MRNLGICVVRTVGGKFLQAHEDNGEMHASNDSQGTEETWYLYQFDKDQHIYGLRNFSNQMFLKVNQGNPFGFTRADASVPENRALWRLVPGRNFGVFNAAAFQNIGYGNGCLFANSPGDDDQHGGGEVHSNVIGPPSNNAGWGGWWFIEPASAPQGGSILGDVLNVLAVELPDILAAATAADSARTNVRQFIIQEKVAIQQQKEPSEPEKPQIFKE
jgi:hypothetical protein